MGVARPVVGHGRKIFAPIRVAAQVVLPGFPHCIIRSRTRVSHGRYVRVSRHRLFQVGRPSHHRVRYYHHLPAERAKSVGNRSEPIAATAAMSELVATFSSQ